MSDVVVTVPKGLWFEWLDEGDLAGVPEAGADEWPIEYHFWIRKDSIPSIDTGERVYIVAHGRLRGYAPLVTVEHTCELAPNRACLVRTDGAEAVTIDEPITGFRGWRYRWWNREDEKPFPEWMKP